MGYDLKLTLSLSHSQTATGNHLTLADGRCAIGEELFLCWSWWLRAL